MTENDSLSTFDQEMLNPEFKASFEKGYREFLLSELIIDLMQESHKSVRKLADEVGVSPTIIQKVRSGKQSDLKMKNFLSIAEACGYHLVLEKNNSRIAI